LPQQIIFKNEELTVVDSFREDLFLPEGKAREYLAKFMFYGESVFNKVKYLSGGEKIRLKLARMLYEDINLIILDEPTNHLDIASIEKFEEVLKDFEGTVFFISHDRYFINQIAERVIAIEDRTFTNYLGNYEEYKRVKDQKKQETLKEPKVRTRKVKKQPPVDKRKQEEAKKRKLEAEVEKIELEIAEIDEAMAGNAFDYQELSELYTKKETLNQTLEKTMEQWAVL